MDPDSPANEDWSEEVIDEPDRDDPPNKKTDGGNGVSRKEQKENRRGEDNRRADARHKRADGGDAAPEGGTRHSEDRKPDPRHNALNDRNDERAPDDRIDRHLQTAEDLPVIPVGKGAQGNESAQEPRPILEKIVEGNGSEEEVQDGLGCSGEERTQLARKPAETLSGVAAEIEGSLRREPPDISLNDSRKTLLQ